MSSQSGPLAAIGRHIPLPLPVPEWSKPIILALLLLAIGFAVRTRIAWRRVSRLEHQRRDLAADLETMQAALVPEVPPRVGELNVSVAYQPAGGPAAGGDFYEIFSFSDGRVAIIVGDVSGHGRDALAHAARMHYALRAYLEAGLAPRGALKLAGRVAARDAGPLFTTAVIAVYEPASASLTYAAAAHPPPIATCPALHEPVTCCAAPALGWGFPTGVRQTTIPFPRGSRACFFTDGLPESQTADGLLGREGIVALLAERGFRLSAAELLQRVRTLADRTRDDMAACVVEATAGPAAGLTGQETVVEELELIEGEPDCGGVERFLRACGVSSEDADRAVRSVEELRGARRDVLLTVYRRSRSASVVVTAPSSELVVPRLDPSASSLAA